MTLRAVAGLLSPDEGRIKLDGRTVFDTAAGIDIPAQYRGVGYVPQQLALFPHLTARQNVEYGLSGQSGDSNRARSAELFALLDMEGYEDRLPSQLSGGQQQRVALARALAPGPRVLLLDEPFSALDADLRRTLRKELVRLMDRFGLTVLFVTHDLAEGYNVADQLVVYDLGRTIDAGPRERVYQAPATRRVAELTGFRNILPGTVRAADGNRAQVEIDGMVITTRAHNLPVGTAVAVSVRPEQILLLRERDGAHGEENVVRGHIVEESAHGNSHTLSFALDSGMHLEVELPAHPYEVLQVAERKEWWLGLRRDSLHVMPD